MVTNNTPSSDPSDNPSLSFDAMPLSDEMRNALSEMGYKNPTPVQAAVWDSVAAGRDVLVQARTGTGKTAAFGLPLIDRIIRANKAEPQALVLCPTRELALQVSREMVKLGKHKDVVTTAIYGGAAIQPQIDAIKNGAQIICGTPGRVLDHLRRGTLDASTIRALVLDESDEMLSMGFERELTAIIDHLPEERQTLLFSATVPPDIERMSRNKLKDPELVILSGDQVGALQIEHFIYWVHRNKVKALTTLIDVESPESAIVFCNTKVETHQVSDALNKLGYEAAWLNGDLAQNEREKVMRRCREGKLRFLVATDVAARGIDISHLTHVINYDFPRDAETYVHRTGRTGRAGRTGTALSLMTPQDIGALYILRLTYKIRPLERDLPTASDERTRDETDIVALLTAAYSASGRSEQARALARRVLTHDNAEELVAGLLAAHLNKNPKLPEEATQRRRGSLSAAAPKPAAPKASTSKRAPSAEKKERRPRRERSDDGPDERPRRKRSTSRDTDAGRSNSGTSNSGPEDASAEDAGAAESSAAKTRTAKTSTAIASAAETAAPQAAAAPAAKTRARRKTSSTKSDTAEATITDDDVQAGEAAAPRARRTRKKASTRTTTSSSSAAAASSSTPRKDASAPTSAPASAPTSAPASAPTSAPASAAEADAPTDDADDGPGPDTVELHVSVGRRHGARAAALKSILEEGGLDVSAVKRVRVRERYTFVEVNVAVQEEALGVLNQANLGEHAIEAGVSSRSHDS